MAYIVPPTFTPGAILTAAQMTILGNDILAGGPIYTTEAARDAAIPSPFEGQRAYITGSTVTTATPSSTAIPTGIQTIYNGAAWVCVTPVGASSGGNGATTSVGYTATLTGSPGTNSLVTLATGVTALVSISSMIYNNSAGNSYMGVAVSGAGTVAAATANSAFSALTGAIVSARTFVITGLTAGTNTFTLVYQAGAHTGNYQERHIVVQGIA